MFLVDQSVIFNYSDDIVSVECINFLMKNSMKLDLNTQPGMIIQL